MRIVTPLPLDFVRAQPSPDDLFQHAFSNAAIGMALVATDGRWLKVNRSLCELVGYGQNELLASTLDLITFPEDRDQDLPLIRQLLAGDRQSYQIERRYLHKDGTPVWVLLAVSLVRDLD